MACAGIFNFILLHLNFSCYCCSIDLKRQSEHSGLPPDTSSFVLVLKIISLDTVEYMKENSATGSQNDKKLSGRIRKIVQELPQ